MVNLSDQSQIRDFLQDLTNFENICTFLGFNILIESFSEISFNFIMIQSIFDGQICHSNILDVVVDFNPEIRRPGTLVPVLPA